MNRVKNKRHAKNTNKTKEFDESGPLLHRGLNRATPRPVLRRCCEIKWSYRIQIILSRFIVPTFFLGKGGGGRIDLFPPKGGNEKNELTEPRKYDMSLTAENTSPFLYIGRVYKRGTSKQENLNTRLLGLAVLTQLAAAPPQKASVSPPSQHSTSALSTEDIRGPRYCLNEPNIKGLRFQAKISLPSSVWWR